MCVGVRKNEFLFAFSFSIRSIQSISPLNNIAVLPLSDVITKIFLEEPLFVPVRLDFYFEYLSLFLLFIIGPFIMGIVLSKDNTMH